MFTYVVHYLHFDKKESLKIIILLFG